MLRFPIIFGLCVGVRKELERLKPGTPEVQRKRQDRIDKLDAEAKLFVGLLATITQAATGPANIPVPILEVEEELEEMKTKMEGMVYPHWLGRTIVPPTPDNIIQPLKESEVPMPKWLHAHLGIREERRDEE